MGVMKRAERAAGRDFSATERHETPRIAAARPSSTQLSDAQTPEPDSALERWRGRLRPMPVKATLKRQTGERLLERPRTVHEAAEELGLSAHTVRAWIASRRLSHLRLGRAIRIPAEEIRRVIEESTVPAVREE